MKDLKYDKNKSKSVLYFTGSIINDMRNLCNSGISEIFMSYAALIRHKAFFLDLMSDISDDGGLFMLDAGSYSFIGKKYKPEMKNPSYWTKYLEEYTTFLRENISLISAATNFDLDKIVGRDVVNEWNKKYFEPLEKEGLQIVYVANESKEDPNALKRFEEYCKKYDYVGIHKRHRKYVSKFYQIAKLNNTRVHGFSFTSFSDVTQYPFFSIDISSWRNSNQFGTSFMYDGKNFHVGNYTKKYIRKQQKVKYREAGIKWGDIEEEDREAIAKMSLLAWKGYRKEYVKAANLKLNTKFVSKYLEGKK